MPFSNKGGNRSYLECVSLTSLIRYHLIQHLEPAHYFGPADECIITHTHFYGIVSRLMSSIKSLCKHIVIDWSLRNDDGTFFNLNTLLSDGLFAHAHPSLYSDILSLTEVFFCCCCLCAIFFHSYMRQQQLLRRSICVSAGTMGIFFSSFVVAYTIAHIEILTVVAYSANAHRAPPQRRFFLKRLLRNMTFYTVNGGETGTAYYGITRRIFNGFSLNKKNIN